MLLLRNKSSALHLTEFGRYKYFYRNLNTKKTTKLSMVIYCEIKYIREESYCMAFIVSGISLTEDDQDLELQGD